MNDTGNKKFLYVFSKADADRLLALGYKEMKADEKHSIFIFLYADEKRRDFTLEPEMVYCLSDTLMF